MQTPNGPVEVEEHTFDHVLFDFDWAVSARVRHSPSASASAHA